MDQKGVPGDSSAGPFMQEMHCCWNAELLSKGVKEVNRLWSVRKINDLLRDPTALWALEPCHNADLGLLPSQVQHQ